MEFDYVIVGGGSAGCVLARRLSDDGRSSVCLLEAGPDDDLELVRMPAGAAAFVPTRWRNWAFETEPQDALGGRRGYQPRGRMLGGSSALNAMIYMRGHPGDYDDWARAGASGWGWSDVLPYFKRSEGNRRGADALHGADGPLIVSDIRSPNPYGRRFLDACAQIGLPANPDFNGPDQEGVGWYQVTQVDGERCSAARAYLPDAVRGRSNLEIVTGARATRVVFDGLRAVAVEYRRDGACRVEARRAVVLAAGAFGSPQILQLSGIGSAPELQRLGIEVFRDAPGVGANLQDHVDYIEHYRNDDPALLGVSLRGAGAMMRALAEWRRDRRGPLTTNFAEAGGFLKTDPARERPDIQLHFVVAMVEDHARRFRWGHGYSCHVCVLRPKSRGVVGLASPDPLAAPSIDPRFLSEPEDFEALFGGAKLMRRILDAPALAEGRRRPLNPLPHADDEWRAAIRARADTIYHPVGTCRMGAADDLGAVVDPQLRVRGVDNLFVADGSVMPRLIGGNTNAPIIMIAERAAEMIREHCG